MTLGELIKGLLMSQEASSYNIGAIMNAKLMLADGSEVIGAKLSEEHSKLEGDLYIYLSDREV